MSSRSQIQSHQIYTKSPTRAQKSLVHDPFPLRMHTGLFWNTISRNVKAASCSPITRPQTVGSGVTKIFARHFTNGVRRQGGFGIGSGSLRRLERAHDSGMCLFGLDGLSSTGIGRRNAFWSAKQKDSTASRAPTQQEEEAGKAAILDKVMKGRQPSDLMLRCEFYFFISCVFFNR
jgi:hypothetical protein